MKTQDLPDFTQWDDSPIPRSLRPLPGRCVIEMDRPPATVKGIVVPETARRLNLDVPKGDYHTAYTGKVLAMTERRNRERKRTGNGERVWIEDYEHFSAGDRVAVELLMNELNRPGSVIVVENKRVMAVIEP